MQVHRLEDYRIRNRQGRSRGTGIFLGRSDQWMEMKTHTLPS